MSSVDSVQVATHHDMLPAMSRRSADHGVQEVLGFSITSPDDENDEDHWCVYATPPSCETHRDEGMFFSIPAFPECQSAAPLPVR